MTTSEWIIWRVETRNELKSRYPEFNEDIIESLLRQLELSYKQLGLIRKEVR